MNMATQSGGVARVERPYQTEAIEKLIKAFQVCEDALLSLPTGGGKTFTAVRAIIQILEAHPGLDCIWVVHRMELFEQATRAFSEEGVPFNVWNADDKEIGLPHAVTICMVASATRLGEALRRTKPRQSFIVAIDEAHHTPAVSYQNILESLQHKLIWKFGLSATPVRLDGEDLGYDRIAYQKTFLDLVHMGYLAKPNYIRFCTRQNYRLQMGGADYSRTSLQQLDNEDRNLLIVSEWMNSRDTYQKALLFAVSREHARNLFNDFQAAGETHVAYVHGDHPKAYRDSVVDWFRRTDRGILINVELFIEGFDVPDIKTIFLVRPTASKTFWFQMLGRGSRIAPGKTEFHIVDFIDSVKRYALLVEQWSMEDLDADPDPDLEEERNEEEFLGWKLGQMEEEGVRVTERLRREAAEIVGILRYSSKVKSNSVAITQTQREALDDLYTDLFANERWSMNDTWDSIQACYDTYITNVEGRQGTFKAREWTSIAWAMFFAFRLRKTSVNGKETFRYISLDMARKELSDDTEM